MGLFDAAAKISAVQGEGVNTEQLASETGADQLLVGKQTGHQASIEMKAH